MIRVLTVRPPWSDLIALTVPGAKRIENRVWTTSWRGVLMIHGGSQVDEEALRLPLVRKMLPVGYEPVRGAIVAVADLTGIHADDGVCTPWSARGQFHWKLDQVQPLAQPVTARGKQRLWKPSPELLEAVAAADPVLQTRLLPAG
ncbi:hypothetical protein ABR738_01345 [Streptomyces sp. Edi4]|uniref:hypothetical protein n=1 Tax=Streptomyces sp. Edi4 TaxID=3162527 RepID=UPI003305E91D